MSNAVNICFKRLLTKIETVEFFYLNNWFWFCLLLTHYGYQCEFTYNIFFALITLLWLFYLNILQVPEKLENQGLLKAESSKFDFLLFLYCQILVVNFIWSTFKIRCNELSAKQPIGYDNAYIFWFQMIIYDINQPGYNQPLLYNEQIKSIASS